MYTKDAKPRIILYHDSNFLVMYHWSYEENRSSVSFFVDQLPFNPRLGKFPGIISFSFEFHQFAEEKERQHKRKKRRERRNRKGLQN